MENMSAEKQFVMKLDDSRVRVLLRAALKGLRENAKKPEEAKKEEPEETFRAEEKWFSGQVSGLSADAREALKEAEEVLKRNPNSSMVEKKWYRYAKKFSGMVLEKPRSFGVAEDPRSAFKTLRDFCRENDLPEEIVPQIVPLLISYMETGHMRPFILIGEKGCGKTTCLKLLLQKALAMPVRVIKVPETARGHGLTGDSGTYKCADVGDLQRGRYMSNSLIMAFIIDEIDKVPHNLTETTIDEELLSITDDSVSTVEDKYMQSVIVGLEYCVFAFTGNDLKAVNPILADRCTIIRYPNPTPERMKSILKKYTDRRLAEKTYRMISIDEKLMNETVDLLIEKGVSSIRKHQEVVESVINRAFTVAVESAKRRTVSATREMFDEAVAEIIGVDNRRKAGFK